MNIEKEEGLVLKSIPFRDREKIITLFTPRRGILSLIVKGMTGKKPHLLTLTTPLTNAEYHFTIGRSELYRFQDGTPLETHSHLRASLPLIDAAATLTNTLLLSQMPHKSAPRLYALTLTYLKNLSANPTTYVHSFILKLLKHEGHLSLPPHCSQCEQPPTHLDHGEPFCSVHTPHRSSPLTPQDWEILRLLTETKKLAPLATETPLYLQELIRKQFNEIYKPRVGV